MTASEPSPRQSSAVGRGLGATFRALRIHNYRLFWLGSPVSMCGNWMQRVAQS